MCIRLLLNKSVLLVHSTVLIFSPFRHTDHVTQIAVHASLILLPYTIIIDSKYKCWCFGLCEMSVWHMCFGKVGFLEKYGDVLVEW